MTKKTYWESLSEDEKKYQLEATSRLERARDQRETPDKEKNNLSYSQLYDLNRESDLAYSDMSGLVTQEEGDGVTKTYEMTSGATRQKDTSIVSHLQSFNFEPDIVAFDRDNKIVNDLGESTEDLIVRSLKLEKWGNRQIDAQREFISQGNVFIREVIAKHATKINSNGSWKAGQKISDFKEDKNAITKYEMKFERQMIPGKNVYLSQIYERDIQKQSEVAIYEEMSLSRARTIYGKWDRWNFVEMTTIKGGHCETRINSIVQSDKGSANWADGVYWNLNKPEADIGILHVYNAAEKTYMIYLNGVMMLPIGFSLYEVSPSGLIPIAKGDAEVIPGYTYAKGIPTNTLVDTKMYDRVWNSMAQKMDQSAKPTMANNTGHTIASNLLYSGRIINGLRANGLTAVLPEEARSITQSETTFAQMAREIIANKSVDDTFSGQSASVDTATELLERKKSTILKLFSLLDGWKSVEEQLARLRIASIYSKWTQPEEVAYFKDIVKVKDGITQIIGKDKTPSYKKNYKNEMVETKFKDTGKGGIRNIRFTGSEDKVPDPRNEDDMYEMVREEEVMSKKYKKPVRISYIQSEEMSRLFDWQWYIEIRQSRLDDSNLDLMVYIDTKMRTANLFPDSLNKEYTLTKIAKIQNEDADKAYNMETQAMSGVQDMKTLKNPMDSVVEAGKQLSV